MEFKNMHVNCELWRWREACAAWDKSRSCKNILRDCCEIIKSHLLGIEFLMILNENGAVKVFLCCVSPTFYNPTETLRRHGRVVKAGLMKMNGTMWKNTFHWAWLNFMAAWRGPQLLDMMSLVYSVGGWTVFVFIFIYSKLLIIKVEYSNSKGKVVQTVELTCTSKNPSRSVLYSRVHRAALTVID